MGYDFESINKQLKEIKVGISDPYFTAAKWNYSVEYSQAFESMISSIIGNKFKGIYKPNLTYEVGDYIWFEGKFYIITASNSREIETYYLPCNTESFAFNSGFITVDLDGFVNLKTNNTSNVISDSSFYDKIYYNSSKDYAIALSKEKLFKIYLNGKNNLEQINLLSVSEESVKILEDDFSIYSVEKDRVIRIQNKSSDNTESELLFISDSEIVDADVSDKYIFTLAKNDTIYVYDKQGVKISETLVRDKIINPVLSMIATSEDETITLYNGETEIHFFFVNSGNLEHSETFVYPGLENINHLSANKGKLVATDDFTITTFDINRYSKKEIDIRDLIINSGSIPTDKLDFAVPFNNGNISSAIGVRNTPYEKTGLEYINGKGFTKGTIKYSNLNFNSKTIIVEGYCNQEWDIIDFGYISSPNRKSRFIINNAKVGKFKLLMTTNLDLYGLTTVYQDVFDTRVNSIVAEGDGEGKIVLDLTKVVISSISIYDGILNEAEQHIFARNSLNIPSTYEKEVYANAPAVADENGIVNLKLKNKTISKDVNGYYVNISDSTSLNDSFSVASSLSVKKVMDEIVNYKTSASRTFTPLGNVEDKYNTAEKISNEIKSVVESLEEFLPKGNVDPKFDTAEKIVKALSELISRPSCPYRVGDHLFTDNATAPNVSWPGTSWKKVEERFLFGTTGNEVAGTLGGNKEISLTVKMMPKHTHTGVTKDGGEHWHDTDFASRGWSGTNSRRSKDQETFEHHKYYRNIAVVGTNNAGLHNHSFTTDSSGSGEAFSILPPFKKTHIWVRTS